MSATNSTFDIADIASWNPMARTPAPPRKERFPEAHAEFMNVEVARVKQAQPHLTHEEAIKVADANWLASGNNPQNGCCIM